MQVERFETSTAMREKYSSQLGRSESAATFAFGIGFLQLRIPHIGAVGRSEAQNFIRLTYGD